MDSEHDSLVLIAELAGVFMLMVRTDGFLGDGGSHLTFIKTRCIKPRQGEFMGAKQSAEMKYAVQLAKTGVPVYTAAREAGVYASSLYKVLKIHKKRKPRNKA